MLAITYYWIFNEDMRETWKHKVIRESLERGYSLPRITKEYKLSPTAIINEIEGDIELKMLMLEK